MASDEFVSSSSISDNGLKSESSASCQHHIPDIAIRIWFVSSFSASLSIVCDKELAKPWGNWAKWRGIRDHVSENLPFVCQTDQTLPELACGYSGGNGWRARLVEQWTPEFPHNVETRAKEGLETLHGHIAKGRAGSRFCYFKLLF